MGIVNVYQSVMIADTIDYEEYEHGIRPDAFSLQGNPSAQSSTPALRR